MVEAIRCAQYVFGRGRIYFEVASALSVALKPDEIDRYNLVNTECNYHTPPREQSELFARAGMSELSGGISVFFVKAILTSDGVANGCAVHPPHRPLLLIGTKTTPWTLAHETGHVLLGSTWLPAHTFEANNLMYAFSYRFNANDEPTLNEFQLVQMRNSPYVARC